MELPVGLAVTFSGPSRPGVKLEPDGRGLGPASGGAARDTAVTTDMEINPERIGMETSDCCVGGRVAELPGAPRLALELHSN